MPLRVSWRFSHSCPLRQILALKGKYEQNLMNRGPKSAIDEVDVIVVDHSPGQLYEPWIGHASWDGGASRYGRWWRAPATCR